MFVLAACADEPEEPRDRKVPLPKTDVIAAVVQLEPFNAGNEPMRPLIMRAVLRCRLDAEGRTRCELEVPRSRARMV
jgi:hypothetical protein